jgi:hypothetical protein
VAFEKGVLAFENRVLAFVNGFLAFEERASSGILKRRSGI